MSIFNNSVRQAANNHEFTAKQEITEDGKLFTVDTRDLYTSDGEIPTRKALFVGDKLINVVSDKYEVHQPSEVLEQFRSVSKEAGLTINQVIPAPNRGGLIITAKYNEVSFLDEKHDLGLFFFTSHCSSYSTFATPDVKRIFCMNQIPAIAADGSRKLFSEKHYNNALDMDTIAPLIERLPRIAAEYGDVAEALAAKKLPVKTFVEMYAKFYKLDPEQSNFNSRINKLLETYFQGQGQGHLGENAYKAFQAVTNLNTHNIRETANANVARYITKQDDSLAFQKVLLAA